MTRSKSQIVENEKQKQGLYVSLEKARDKIQVRLDVAKQIISKEYHNTEDSYKEMSILCEKWDDYNQVLLEMIYGGDYIFRRYSRGYFFLMLGGSSYLNRIELYLDVLKGKISELELIMDSLDLISEMNPIVDQGIPSKGDLNVTNKVFIVHGHDEISKLSVARFVEKFGLEAIILEEQVSGGKTIIEKLEAHSLGACYAIVLLTSDDIGTAKIDEKNLRPRARQNVILELGYFYGILGRNRVCALYKDDLELPSDMQGILWVRMDAGGAWKLRLAREMKESGLDIDLNKLD